MTQRPRTDEAAGGRSNDPPVLILTSLADGEKHGYALLQDIEAFAGVRLGPGTLYGAISRLEERGLIEAAAPSPICARSSTRARLGWAAVRRPARCPAG
jgi:hypothetical protein